MVKRRNKKDKGERFTEERVGRRKRFFSPRFLLSHKQACMRLCKL